VQCLYKKNLPCKGEKFEAIARTVGFEFSKPLPLRVLPLLARRSHSEVGTGEISAFSVFPFFKGKCRSRSGGSRKGV